MSSCYWSSSHNVLLRRLCLCQQHEVKTVFGGFWTLVGACTVVTPLRGLYGLGYLVRSPVIMILGNDQKKMNASQSGRDAINYK